MLNDKPSDESVVATASNNIITLRKGNEKLFDSLKRSERASKVDESKLSVRQRRAIQLNRCLLLMMGKKVHSIILRILCIIFGVTNFPFRLVFRDRDGVLTPVPDLHRPRRVFKRLPPFRSNFQAASSQFSLWHRFSSKTSITTSAIRSVLLCGWLNFKFGCVYRVCLSR